MTLKSLYLRNEVFFPVAVVAVLAGHYCMFKAGASALIYVPWVCCLIALLFGYAKPKIEMVKGGLRAMVQALIILCVYIGCIVIFR